VCAGPCVVNWAYALFAQRGKPDDTEHAWLMAAISLAEGVRDWRFLHRYVAPPAANTRSRPGTGPPPVRGLINMALDRFPNDPALRLHLAMAAASRFAVTAEGGRLTVDPFGPMVASTNVMVTGPNGRPQMALMPRYESRDETLELFRALQDDPAVGAEARMRRGYLLWASDQDAAARADLSAAASAARDADVRYLAHFLLGWTALNSKELKEAHTQLTRALEVRPGSQSATLALAAVQLQQGEGTRAYDLAQASLAKADDDPWRLFLYGHHAKLPSRIAELRRRIQR
jgi:tetratricopeptide (TPR) repeat protein